MSLVACTRDLASGLTTGIGGKVVAEGAGGKLIGHDPLGILATGVSVVSLWVFLQVKSAEVK